MPSLERFQNNTICLSFFVCYFPEQQSFENNPKRNKYITDDGVYVYIYGWIFFPINKQTWTIILEKKSSTWKCLHMLVHEDYEYLSLCQMRLFSILFAHLKTSSLFIVRLLIVRRRQCMEFARFILNFKILKSFLFILQKTTDHLILERRLVFNSPFMLVQ
jgi:hypothetical protein